MSNPTVLREKAAETFLAYPDWWVDGSFIGILFGVGIGLKLIVRETAHNE